MRKMDFSVCLVVLGAAMLMGTASAVETGTTEIAAQFLSYISVEAPPVINDWVIIVGDNQYPGSRNAIISSNYDGDIDLRVRDGRTGGTGQMTSDVDPLVADYQLENPLVITSAPFPAVSLSDADDTIYTFTAPNYMEPPVTFDQTVTYTDFAADYHMIITFTGTVAL